jgi:hypothetical protein
MIESLIVLAILIAAVLYVLGPLLGAGPAAAAETVPPADAPREELATALADLEYDLRAGKLPAESYAELKEQLQRRLRESR